MAVKRNLSLLLKKRQKKGLELVQFHGVCLLLAINAAIFTILELVNITHWLFALGLFFLSLSFLLLAGQIKKTDHLRKGRTRLLVVSLLGVVFVWYWAAGQALDPNLFYALALTGNLLVSSQRSILRNLLLFAFTFGAFRLIWWWISGQAYGSQSGQLPGHEITLGLFFTLAAFALLFISRFRVQQQKAESKELQAKLVKQKQMLHNTGNRLEALSASVAHNLRSPLMGLRMLNSMADKVDAKEQKEISQQSKVAIQHMYDMVEDLALVIGDYRQLKEPFQRLNLEMELKQVLEDLGPLINSHNAKISYDFARLKRISFPQNFLRYILAELITNAIKHHESSNQLAIGISTRRNHGGGLISVSDNGPGIDLNEYGEQVVKLYGKLDPKNKDKRGLGLYRIKSQVELSGGLFSIKSKLGEGTAVEIGLP